MYTIKTDSPPIAFDISTSSTSYALGMNDGSIIVRSQVVEEPGEEKTEDDLEGIVINTETKSTKVSKSYKYFYRGAYMKAKEDEIKVLLSTICYHISLSIFPLPYSLITLPNSPPIQRN